MSRTSSSLPLPTTCIACGLLSFVSTAVLFLPSFPAFAKPPVSFTTKLKDALNDGDADAALKLLSSPDAKQLSEIKRLNYLNEACAMKGDSKGALKCLSKLLTLNPDKKVDYLFQRAALYRGLKQYNLALTDYNHILSITSGNSSWALIERSAVYRALGRYQDALNDLAKASTDTKVQFEAWRDSCLLCVQIGKHSEAISFADKLIKQSPGEASYYIVRAREHAKLNNLLAASKDLRTAESLSPEDRTDINLVRKEILNLAPSK